MSRGLELSRQWNKVITRKPVGALASITLDNGGLESLFNLATHLLSVFDTFAHEVVTDRRDHSIRIWFALPTRPLANLVFWFTVVRLICDSSTPGYHLFHP